MASTLIEQAEAAGAQAAHYEGQARRWLAATQRPITANGRLLALQQYGSFQRRAQHMRAVEAQLIAEAAAEGVA